MAQGRDGARLLEPHPGIELFGHDRLEIMARAFGFGPIDNPDRAFQQWLGKPRHQLASRSEEHTSELQSLMRISYADFCYQKNQPTIQGVIPHSVLRTTDDDHRASQTAQIL